MAYHVRHRSRARDELEQCRASYPSFTEDVDAWMAQLGSAVERRDNSISIDLGYLLDVVTNPQPGAWSLSVRKWLRAPVREKVQALFAAIRKRCPPWEMRVSIASFSFLGVNSWEVHVYYEVDHAEGQVIVTRYDGLPGQSIP